MLKIVLRVRVLPTEITPLRVEKKQKTTTLRRTVLGVDDENDNDRLFVSKFMASRRSFIIVVRSANNVLTLAHSQGGNDLLTFNCVQTGLRRPHY